MKLLFVSAICAALTTVYAHYECTTQEAFDVLFSNATTDAFAQRLLDSLKSGVAGVRGEINQADADKAAKA
ncbi:hypothetical protein H4S02_007412, partial [Coemansia sp. RSA 2611]